MVGMSSTNHTIMNINKNKQLVLEFLKTITPSPQGQLAILGGHYSLVVEDGKTVPGIYQSIQNPVLKEELRTHAYSAEFPHETFLTAVELLLTFPQAKLISLVNDWMMIPKTGTGPEGNPFRKQYYQQASVPSVYEKILKQNGLTKEVFLQVPKKDRFYKNAIHFSETRFRNLFNKKLSATCSLQNGCAQEFVPFLQAMSGEGFSDLIAFIPATCKIPVNDAVRYARSELGLPIRVWIVIFHQFIGEPWTGFEIWENGEWRDGA